MIVFILILLFFINSCVYFQEGSLSKKPEFETSNKDFLLRKFYINSDGYLERFENFEDLNVKKTPKEKGYHVENLFFDTKNNVYLTINKKGYISFNDEPNYFESFYFNDEISSFYLNSSFKYRGELFFNVIDNDGYSKLLYFNKILKTFDYFFIDLNIEGYYRIEEIVGSNDNIAVKVSYNNQILYYVYNPSLDEVFKIDELAYAEFNFVYESSLDYNLLKFVRYLEELSKKDLYFDIETNSENLLSYVKFKSNFKNKKELLKIEIVNDENIAVSYFENYLIKMDKKTGIIEKKEILKFPENFRFDDIVKTNAGYTLSWLEERNGNIGASGIIYISNLFLD